ERQRDLARCLGDLGALGRVGRDQHVVRPRRLRHRADAERGQQRGDDDSDQAFHDEAFFRLRRTAPTPAPAPSAPSARPMPPSQRAVVSVTSSSAAAFALSSPLSCEAAAAPPWWPSPDGGANSTAGAGLSASGSSSAQLTV